MESNMLEKRIEQMKEGFEGILLNLLKFNWTVHENLTLLLLLYNRTGSSFMNNEGVRQDKVLEKIIFQTLWRVLKASTVTFFSFYYIV